MTLNEYIHLLTELRENNPTAGELKCLYARDDEGNAFAPVIYEPSIMKNEEIEVTGSPAFTLINAICIN